MIVLSQPYPNNDVINRMYTCGCIKTFQKNEILFSIGDPANHIYFILSGKIRINRLNEDGDEMTVGIRSNGDPIGLAEIFLQESRKCYGIAIENSVICIIEAAIFRRMIYADPALSEWVHYILSKRLRSAEDQLFTVGVYNTEGRLAKLIIKFAELFGECINGNILINLSLTNQEYATFIGSTRQSVNQVLNEWKELGYIKIDRKRISVQNIDALRKLKN